MAADEAVASEAAAEADGIKKAPTGMEGWSQPGIHPLETNMSTENQWLEDVRCIPYRKSSFLWDMLVFGG